MVFQALAVDLFVVLPDRQWGPTFLIRTGPGDANQVLVTPDGVRNRDGNVGVLPDGLKFDEGGVLRIGAGLLDTPTELATFAACGLPWLAPPLRSVWDYQLEARFRLGTAADFVPRDVPPTDVCAIVLADDGTPREDAIWTPKGDCVFLDPALARPTVQFGQSAPVVQTELFERFA